MSSERKYEKYIYTADRTKWPFIPSHAGKVTGLMGFSKTQHEEAPHFISINLIHGAGAGFGGGEPGGGAAEGKRKLPHKHPAPFYETFSFIGTDPDNPDDLGGTVEFWIGEGEAAEKYIITKPTTIIIPPETVHLPEYFLEVRKPFLTVVILQSAELSAILGTTYEKWHPDFQHRFKEE